MRERSSLREGIRITTPTHDLAAVLNTLGIETAAVVGHSIGTAGLVLSQFWPDAPPGKHSFPMRNAVMSGYGRATIVVEAGEHSGARIQARQAVAHGRPVILTDLVVRANRWPADLIGRPGVHVAHGTAEVMTIVEDIIAASNEVDELLAFALR
ncbi:DNA-processing protein DprA [Amycolatopsis thermoflava]|uniref:DNA-processing protein DprA n=1 Tax=Amycolatopsis thermoflava TaxID=84480 RepID=UPI003EC138DD